MSISKSSLGCVFAAAVISCSVVKLQAQTLVWDANGASAGQPAGPGQWFGAALWFDGVSNVAWDNGGSSIAQLGSVGAALVSGNIITITGATVNVGGIDFMSLAAAPGSTNQFAIAGASGGTLNFADNAVLQFQQTTSTGSAFATFASTLPLTGNGLVFQKYTGSGTTMQFVRVDSSSNPGLTGPLTIKGNDGGIFLRSAAAGTFAAMSSISIETNGTLSASGGGLYTLPISIAGFGGASQYGAIRVDGSNTTFTQPITLTADAGIQTNTGGITGTVLAGGITGPFGFTRFATGSGNGTLTLSAASDYTGPTTLGRLGSFAGGVTILDFSAAVTTTDLLYNGVGTPGAVAFIGGNNSPTVLRLNGKTDVINSQALGNITVGGASSSIGGLGIIDLVSSGAGQMNLSVGTITRDARGMLAIFAPTNGTMTTTQADGFLGPWATYRGADGKATWAQVSGGVVQGGFTGNLVYETGTAVSALAGYSTGSHLTVAQSSQGPASLTGATTDIATVSMTDGRIDRTLALGGTTLRLGATPTGGGIQLAADGKNFTIAGGTITGGGTVANTAGQLFLTNQSSSARLQVDASITNNGTGAIFLMINGAPDSRTILTAANTFTGNATIASGSLEIRNAGSLGSAGTVSVLEGAALLVSGDLSLTRTLGIAGSGPGGSGVLRLLSGTTTVSGVVTQNGPSLIVADAGASLTIQSASATTTALAGSHVASFGGSGMVTVNGRIATSSSGLTKTGNGLLVLTGDNNFTGAVTISQGVLRVGHANALGVSGTSFSTTSVSAGAALELTGGITLAAEPITLASTGVNNGGGIRNVAGDNTTTGAITLNATTTRIHSDAGLLTLGGAGNATTHASTSARTLIFGGSGDVQVIRPMARTSTGAFTVSKEGNGTLILASAVNNTITLASAGVMKLDFSAASSPASNILGATNALTMGGGTLRLTGKAGATNAQSFGTLTVSTYSQIEFEQNGATAMNMTFGNFSRSWAGILAISGPTTGALTTSGTTGVADNEAISRDGRVYAVIRDSVGGDEWAGTSAVSAGLRSIVKLSALGLSTPSTATTLSGHADIALGIPTTTLSAETEVSSLRFAAAQATTIAQSGSQILNAGGILVSSTVGANDTIIAAPTRPTASTENNPELVIVQNNTEGSLILQNGIINRTETGRTIVTVAKAGPGLVVIGGTSTFSGNLRVYEGPLQFAGGATVSSSMEFILGSGSNSGKIILGSATAASPLIDYFTTAGSGTDNRIVGGSTAMSRLTITGSTSVPSTYSAGYLGGNGVNENNLELRLATANGRLTLGAGNTYSGATILSRGTVEVTRLADAGLASSLGTGSAASTISAGDATTSALGSSAIATIRYLGGENSSTNRAINLLNSDVAAEITVVSLVLENNGSGTVKFTSPFTVGGSNPVGRVFKLAGSNTGANEIVSLGEISAANPTSLVKDGPGSWTVTGASVYTGGTTILGGSLIVTNGSGSATGLGAVAVGSGTVLGGTGRIAPASDQSVSVDGGTLQVGAEAPGAIAASSTLTLATSGNGITSLANHGAVVFDLFGGAGAGDNTGTAGAADTLIVGGILQLDSTISLHLNNPNAMTAWAAGDSWRLFDWATLGGSLSGTFADTELPTLPEDLEWDLTELATSGTVRILQIPEPSRLALAVVATLGVLLRRKRGRY